MGIKSTSTIKRERAIELMVEAKMKKKIAKLKAKLFIKSNKEIEDILEKELDIWNPDSEYYFDNFLVVNDDYESDY